MRQVVNGTLTSTSMIRLSWDQIMLQSQPRLRAPTMQPRLSLKQTASKCTPREVSLTCRTLPQTLSCRRRSQIRRALHPSLWWLHQCWMSTPPLTHSAKCFPSSSPSLCSLCSFHLSTTQFTLLWQKRSPVLRSPCVWWAWVTFPTGSPGLSGTCSLALS